MFSILVTVQVIYCDAGGVSLARTVLSILVTVRVIHCDARGVSLVDQ